LFSKFLGAKQSKSETSYNFKFNTCELTVNSELKSSSLLFRIHIFSKINKFVSHSDTYFHGEFLTLERSRISHILKEKKISLTSPPPPPQAQALSWKTLENAKKLSQSNETTNILQMFYL